MDDATPMNLVPSPDQLVSVIETIVSADWPETNEDHDAYFLRLGLQKKEPSWASVIVAGYRQILPQERMQEANYLASVLE